MRHTHTHTHTHLQSVSGRGSGHVESEVFTLGRHAHRVVLVRVGSFRQHEGNRYLVARLVGTVDLCVCVCV